MQWFKSRDDESRMKNTFYYTTIFKNHNTIAFLTIRNDYE